MYNLNYVLYSWFPFTGASPLLPSDYSGHPPGQGPSTEDSRDEGVL